MEKALVSFRCQIRKVPALVVLPSSWRRRWRLVLQITARTPRPLAPALRASHRASHPKVGAYAIFVAEPGAAQWMVRELPFGRGFSVLDTGKLPNTIKEIMLHAAATAPAD